MFKIDKDYFQCVDKQHKSDFEEMLSYFSESVFENKTYFKPLAFSETVQNLYGISRRAVKKFFNDPSITDEIIRDIHSHIVGENASFLIYQEIDDISDVIIEFQEICNHLNSGYFFAKLCTEYPIFLHIYVHKLLLIVRFVSGAIKNIKSLDFFAQSDLSDFNFFLGDSHNSANGTFSFKTEFGKYYYKPRSLENEKVLYNDLFPVIFSANEFSNVTIFSESCFGIMSEIEHNQIASNFFLNWGKVLGLLYLSSSRDITFENVISSNGIPQIIDLECFLTPILHKDNKSYFHLTEKAFEYSVFPMSVLPNELVGALTSPLLIHSNVKKDYPNYLSHVKSFNYENRTNFLHLPSPEINLNSQDISELCNGFEEFFKTYSIDIYNLLAKKIRSANFISRILVRNTFSYQKTIYESRKPIYLASGASFLSAFDFLMEDKTVEQKVKEDELQQLLNGDIPYYYTLMDSKHLFSDRGLVQNNYFSLTSIEVLNELKKIWSTRDFIIESINAITNHLRIAWRVQAPIARSDTNSEFLSHIISLLKERSLPYKKFRTFLEYIQTIQNTQQVEKLRYGVNGLISGYHGIYLTLKLISNSNPVILPKWAQDSIRFFENTSHHLPEHQKHLSKSTMYTSPFLDLFLQIKFEFGNNELELTDQVLKALDLDKGVDMFGGMSLVLFSFFSETTRNITSVKRYYKSRLTENSKYLYINQYENTGNTVGVSHGVSGIIPTFIKIFTQTEDPYFKQGVIKMYNYIYTSIDFEKNIVYFNPKREDATPVSYSHGSVGIYYTFKYMFNSSLIDKATFTKFISLFINQAITEKDKGVTNFDILNGYGGIVLTLLDIRHFYLELLDEILTNSVEQCIAAFEEYCFSGSISSNVHYWSTSLYDGISGLVIIFENLRCYNPSSNFLDFNFFSIENEFFDKHFGD